MFGTDLDIEYAIAARLLDLDARGLTQLAAAAVDASFASRESKAALRAEIISYAATQAP
jgi:aminodeoxyfutalosine deaminase